MLQLTRLTKCRALLWFSTGGMRFSHPVTALTLLPNIASETGVLVLQLAVISHHFTFIVSLHTRRTLVVCFASHLSLPYFFE